MNKKFTKCFKKFALFSICLMMLLAPSTVNAKNKVTTKNTVKRVVNKKVVRKKKNSKNGNKLGILSTDDIVSFSGKGKEGKGKVVRLDVEYNKSNKEVTNVNISLPYEVTKTNSNKEYWSILNENYRFKVEQVILSHNGKKLTFNGNTLKQKISNNDNKINFSYQGISDVNNGDEITAKVYLSWKRGSKFKMSSAGKNINKSYDYTITAKINVPDSKTYEPINDDSSIQLSTEPVSLSANGDKKTEKAQVVTLNVIYDKSNSKITRAYVSLPEYVVYIEDYIEDNSSSYAYGTNKTAFKDGPYKMNIERVILSQNNKEIKDVSSSGGNTSLKDNIITVNLGEINDKVKEGDIIKAKVYLTWRRGNGYSIISGGVSDWDDRKPYVWDILLKIEMPETITTPTQPTISTPEQTTSTIPSKILTFSASPTKDKGQLVKLDMKYDKNNKKITETVISLPEFVQYDSNLTKDSPKSDRYETNKLAYRVSVTNYKQAYQFMLDQAFLIVNNGRKVDMVSSKTSKKDNIMTFNFGEVANISENSKVTVYVILKCRTGDLYDLRAGGNIGWTTGESYSMVVEIKVPEEPKVSTTKGTVTYASDYSSANITAEITAINIDDSKGFFLSDGTKISDSDISKSKLSNGYTKYTIKNIASVDKNGVADPVVKYYGTDGFDYSKAVKVTVDKIMSVDIQKGTNTLSLISNDKEKLVIKNDLDGNNMKIELYNSSGIIPASNYTVYLNNKAQSKGTTQLTLKAGDVVKVTHVSYTNIITVPSKFINKIYTYLDKAGTVSNACTLKVIYNEELGKGVIKFVPASGYEVFKTFNDTTRFRKVSTMGVPDEILAWEDDNGVVLAKFDNLDDNTNLVAEFIYRKKLTNNLFSVEKSVSKSALV